jgi:hypothetical protein
LNGKPLNPKSQAPASNIFKLELLSFEGTLLRFLAQLLRLLRGLLNREAELRLLEYRFYMLMGLRQRHKESLQMFKPELVFFIPDLLSNKPLRQWLKGE